MRKDYKKLMVIGSGPIVIGQAAEFDFSGTQACRSLREEGYKTVLVNSNPATIQTDTDTADSVSGNGAEHHRERSGDSKKRWNCTKDF